MILRAHVPEAEPWRVGPDLAAEDLYRAFREAAAQTFWEHHYEIHASLMFADMERCLREPGDQYRAPVGGDGELLR